MTRPSLLFYCQHSLGLGHLIRSLALAEGLTAHFDVVLLNGGRMPAGASVPQGVEVVNLPALGHDAGDYRLVTYEPGLSVEQAQAIRREAMLAALDRVAPRVVLVELFPFGRKRFAFELEPLLEACAARGEDRPRVVSSVRDILVTQRSNQARHDERACRRANRWFDAVLVHADPAFARLEDSFRPATPLRVPVHYTGFIAPPRPQKAGAPAPRVLVSAGGGMVGEPLFRAAVDAHREVADRCALTTTIVAGPFLPEAALLSLEQEAAGSPDLEVLPHVPDLCHEMQRSAVSVSQGGYNTTMDILRAGTRAVVVPFSEGKEDEQGRRAERLAALGALRVLQAGELDGRRLARDVTELVAFRPAPVDLDLEGRDRSAAIVAELAGV